jgi:ABC-type transport system involved in cytochrome c biogenesis permease subunit
LGGGARGALEVAALVSLGVSVVGFVISTFGGSSLLGIIFLLPLGEDDILDEDGFEGAAMM